MFFLPALQEHLSEEYGISYFWNRVTNESRWDRPSRVLACAYLDSVATQVCDIFWSFLLLWLSALPIKDMAGLQHETASSRDSAAADSCHGLSLPTRAQMFVSSSQCLRPRVRVCVSNSVPKSLIASCRGTRDVWLGLVQRSSSHTSGYGRGTP